MVTAFVITGLVAVAFGHAIGASGGRAVLPCPGVDAGCRSQALAGGLVTDAAGRYQLIGAGGIVVLGRWRCGPMAFPAVLDVATGEVWIFDRWATAGHAVVARPLGRFAGARDLRVVPVSSGCDRLEVRLPHRQTSVFPQT
jgi:hypothetical protein